MTSLRKNIFWVLRRFPLYHWQENIILTANSVFKLRHQHLHQMVNRCVFFCLVYISISYKIPMEIVYLNLHLTFIKLYSSKTPRSSWKRTVHWIYVGIRFALVIYNFVFLFLFVEEFAELKHKSTSKHSFAWWITVSHLKGSLVFDSFY